MSPKRPSANPAEASQLLFEQSPLITPERLRTGWRNAFLPWPKWVRILAFPSALLAEEDDPNMVPDLAFVRVGKKHLKDIHLALPELAVLYELTRLGAATVDTNSNFGKPVPQIYVKMHFRAAKHDLMNIRRILWEAGAGEETKALWRDNDYSVNNTYSEAHAHPEKDAREVALGHARTHAEQRHKAGTFPSAFTLSAYLANITALFALVDQQKGA